MYTRVEVMEGGTQVHACHVTSLGIRCLSVPLIQQCLKLHKCLGVSGGAKA